MLSYFWIMIGGALGTGARVWAASLIGTRYGEGFPYGTLFVNITGSLLIGLFAGFTDAGGAVFANPRVRQFVMLGLCGGYTTFSSFSLQTLELAQSGEWLKAGAYSLLSFTCCLLAVWLGRCAVLCLR